MRNHTYWLWLCLSAFLSPAAVAAEQTGNWLQLYRFDQANRQTLERLQRQSSEQTVPRSTQESYTLEHLQRTQRSEQRSLQERQRRQRLIYDQQHRIIPQPAPSQEWLKRQQQEQRMRQQQHYQLDRFRIQNQLRPWHH
jgi:hypothetical protein